MARVKNNNYKNNPFSVRLTELIKEKGVKPKKHLDKKPPFVVMEDFFKAGQQRGEFRTDYTATECASMFFSIIQGATIGYVIAPKDLQKKMTLPSVDFILNIFTNTRS